jgi:hypothetical protein
MARVREARRAGFGTLVQLGDLGAPWPGKSGAKYLRKLELACARHEVRLLCVPGNHEDWGTLTRFWTERRHRDEHGHPRPLQLSDHIAVLPRGHRWTSHGLSFAAVGGAPSVDFEARTPGVDWWPEECMTEAEAQFIAAKEPVDVLLAHESPDPPYATSAVTDVITGNPNNLSGASVRYAARGRRRLTHVFLRLRPRLLVHGHYHLADEATVAYASGGGAVRILSVPAAGHPRNLQFVELPPRLSPRRGR